jgi:hypothetical protein
VLLAAPLTVRVAEVLVSSPKRLRTVTVKEEPESADAGAGATYDARVAPEIAVPFFNHWYDNGADPDAATVNRALCPDATVWLVGCPDIEGATEQVRPQPAISGTKIGETISINKGDRNIN